MAVEPLDSVDDIGGFVARYRPAMLRLALGLCRDLDTAEDVVQETLARLVPRWSMVCAATYPWAYVRQATVRVFLSSRDERTVYVSEHADVADGHDAMAGVDDLDAAVRRIRSLPARSRAVLALRYIEELDDQTIADVLGTTRAAVRVAAHRALRQLAVQTERHREIK
ncbi:sigma-70 family RNA polymerase sigma factor [Cellulomonas sp. CW35]|uniref:RNA polymerase sigma24 factor n=1 Tax=Cellulomonas uda TaxID=1714 RepID=A0A4Y3KA15_CELUD|nr:MULTISPECIES: sigma-70 family RNA polymerase sigma factor [Cellulomonas]ASR53913.1 hypothetical protein CBP52_00675 [Cellulomonas sp. PSBB021]NII67324.1 RNA polymerase sigma factor (sigma-70 family) [Cellulomonas uda]UJP41276.1 sigma-70 family RNA polymerase sigma factor [Cellulomonas palmilytica]GEA80802.1 RNA polymerase sigma24 factor [Cellulomonas uda]